MTEADNRHAKLESTWDPDTLIGHKFGRLTVKEVYITKDRRAGYNRTRVRTECECGREHFTSLANLVAGTGSCGCKREEYLQTRRVNLTYKGETRTVKEWAAEFGLKPNTILVRLRRGWDIERTLTQPLPPKGPPSE